MKIEAEIIIFLYATCFISIMGATIAIKETLRKMEEQFDVLERMDFGALLEKYHQYVDEVEIERINQVKMVIRNKVKKMTDLQKEKMFQRIPEIMDLLFD